MYMMDFSIIILIPGLLLGMYAQGKVKSTYHQYSKINAQIGFTGETFARKMLDDNGLHHVSITQIDGVLTDHYDPRALQVRLSRDVYNGSDLAALGIAAHEVGHVIQHLERYFPLRIRNAVIPMTNLSSYFYMPLIFLGLALQNLSMVNIGIILFSMIVFFQVITLPVEFNASSRALYTLQEDKILNSHELLGAKKVLGAAALTYVAALINAILQLLQFVILFSGSRRD